MKIADELPALLWRGIRVDEDHAHGCRLWNHDVLRTVRWYVLVHARRFEMDAIFGDLDCQVVLLRAVIETDQAILILHNVQVLAERALNVVDHTFGQGRRVDLKEYILRLLDETLIHEKMLA